MWQTVIIGTGTEYNKRLNAEGFVVTPVARQMLQKMPTLGERTTVTLAGRSM